MATSGWKIRIDVARFIGEPTLLAVSPQARTLWLNSLCWISHHETDHIGAAVFVYLIQASGIEQNDEIDGRHCVNELIAAGLATEDRATRKLYINEIPGVVDYGETVEA